MLQEKVLSRRLLLFTDFQVYYRCANSVCSEDVAMEAGSISTNIQRRANPFEWGATREAPSFLESFVQIMSLGAMKLKDKNWQLTFFPSYVALVAEFTQRTFTSKLDTLNGIAGVLSTLDDSKLAFLGGLPRVWLAEALLWQPEAGSIYSINPKSSRVGIPSWSWAGWSLSQPCVWPQYADENAMARTKDSMLIHLERSVYGQSWPRCYRISENGGLDDGDGPTSFVQPWLSTNARQHLKQSGILLSFPAQVRQFSIGEATEPAVLPEDALQSFYLLNSAGLEVGIVWTCARVAQSPHDHTFIALSQRETGLAIRDAVAIKHLREYEISDPASWYVRNVMLVEWDGDVALRVATGQIIKSAWGNREKRWVYLG